MIGTLGQFVREICDLLTGSGDPIPVDIVGGDMNLEDGGGGGNFSSNTHLSGAGGSGGNGGNGYCVVYSW
jgi:hypothetical protein